MKKSIFLISMVLILASCGGGADNKSADQLQQENDSLRQALSEADSQVEDMVASISAVQDGFAAINAAEGRVNLESSTAAEKPNTTEAIKEEMQFITETISKNKDEIQKLNKQLKDSRYNSGQLKKTVEKLTAQLSEKVQQLEQMQKDLEAKNIRIAELDDAVTNLTSDVNKLTEDKMKNEEEISNQDKQINTAWYVYGTKKELKDQKILDSGEVLRSGNFNKNYFTQIDIRKEKVFELHSKSAKILTTHPEGSYTLEKDSKKQYVLTISDPEKFWSVSRYLVIQVR